VDRIVVTEMRERTFYAEIQMTQADEPIVVSSRPSDAIALAVRATVPIYADEGVLSEAGIEIEDADEDEVERFKEFLEQVTPEDFRE
jgi:bifunctional DNase/RNase